jgi:hypothetical protein
LSNTKVKASKVKVYAAPEGTSGLDGQFHVYVFDVVAKSFAPTRSFDTVEKAVSFQRHEQERFYAEQEAAPELFDLPFISNDPDLVARAGREPEYRERLVKELGSEARGRARRH